MSDSRCFLYGLGLGVAAGVLMAPRAGANTRKQLADSAREGQDAVLRQGAQIKDTVIDTMNRTKRAAKTTADGVEAAFAAGKAELVG